MGPTLARRLFIHGDDDCADRHLDLLSSKLVKDATLNIYPDAPHGLCSTHKDQVLCRFAGIL